MNSQAAALLDNLPNIPKLAMSDRGHTIHIFREQVWDRSARPATPCKRNEALVASPDWIYNNRN